MRTAIMIVTLFLIPFLLAGMMKSIKDLDKEGGFGPLPYCIAMGIVLNLLWFATF